MITILKKVETVLYFKAIATKSDTVVPHFLLIKKQIPEIFMSFRDAIWTINFLQLYNKSKAISSL